MADPDPPIAYADQGDFANQKAIDDAAAAKKAAADQAAAIAAQQQALNNHYNYGGSATGAADASNYYGGLAAGAQGRQGVGIDYDGNKTSQAYNQGQESRQNQMAMAGLMAARANGQVPSISQMQADRQMGQAAAEQSSAAASARGPAGLALAQQGAAANTANMQANISNTAQINGANERMQAEQAAFGAYSGMRSGDAASEAQRAQEAQAQAGLEAQQRGLNDARSSGLYGNQIAVNTAQLGAQGNQVATAAGVQVAQNQLAQNQSQYDSSRFDKYIGYGAGALGTGAAIAAGLFFGGGGGGQTPNYGGAGNNPGAGGYNGNAVPDGSLTPGTSGGSYGQGDYGPDPDPNHSDITAKQNIGGLAAVSHHARVSDQEAARLQAQMLGLRQDAGAQYGALMDRGPAVDPATAQFGSGLAPSSYEYKPGLGSPGMKVGPMAQNMVANPITATAVRRDPATGLLSIDRNDGLKVALGGVGHLASKQQATDLEIAKLKVMAAEMQRNTAAQQGGLMGDGPSVRRIADGARDNGYNTELTKGAEEAYQRYARRQFPGGMNDDYDLRGAFASGTQRDGASGHYPDTYKKPNHPTFSDESQYASYAPESAGSWDGERYQAKGPPAWLRQIQEAPEPEPSIGDMYLAHARGY